MAHAVSAATNGQMRVSMGPTATAALEPDCEGEGAEEFAALFDLAGEEGTADDLDVPDVPDVPDGVEAVPLGFEGALGAEAETELDPVVPELEVVVVLVASKVGGGTAVEGSTSAPVP